MSEKKVYFNKPQRLTQLIGANTTVIVAGRRTGKTDYNTAAKSNRFGTQDKPNKNVIRTWATTQEKSIQRISRPK